MLSTAKERVSEPENTAVEAIKTEKQRKGNTAKDCRTMEHMKPARWESQEKNKGAEMTKSTLVLLSDIKLQNHEAQKTLSKINEKKKTGSREDPLLCSLHLSFRTFKIKILDKAKRGEKLCMKKEPKIRVPSDIFKEML